MNKIIDEIKKVCLEAIDGAAAAEVTSENIYGTGCGSGKDQIANQILTIIRKETP